MSFIKLTKNLFENISLTLHPQKSFASSSIGGITGSEYVSPIRSKRIKDLVPVEALGETPIVNNNPTFNVHQFALVDTYESVINAAKEALFGGPKAAVQTKLREYMNQVNSAPNPEKDSKKFNIIRYEPPVDNTMNFISKTFIKEMLMKYYRANYDTCYFGYTNYNSLNFYTASNTGQIQNSTITLPTSSSLIYPNRTYLSTSNGYVLENFIYTPESEFTIDFYINPRYTTDSENDAFKTGTLFHLSSSFAVSLMTGSSKDGCGLPDGYRIALQLSHSAGMLPSTLNPANDGPGPGRYPRDLIFFSPDNSLKRNKWHHVSITWGGINKNNGTGSIYIDDDISEFVVPSASIYSCQDALIVGNYFEGTGSNLKLFFNENASKDEGVIDWNSGIYKQDPNPASVTFNHPLNAEVHDLKIYKKYLAKAEIENNRKYGTSLSDKNLIFYVPPFFTKQTRNRNKILVTPFQHTSGTTDDPFNVSFSFGVGGKLINLENFSREHVYGEFPRLLHLTASIIDESVTNITAEQFIYDWIYDSTGKALNDPGKTIKINHTVLPCDNGLFYPSFDVLKSGSMETYYTSSNPMSSFVNFLGNLDTSIVSLDNLIPSSTLFPGLIQSSGSILEKIYGASPENPGVPPGSVLTIYQRTRDNSSNQVVIFDISNLFYGNRIDEGSFKLVDPGLTGSGGKIRLTFKDNGNGSLYRADCLTPHATWSSAGNIFYNEGLAIIKTPHAVTYGKDHFETSFKGEQNIHILNLSVPCEEGLFNSSSNPSYRELSASFDQNDRNSKYVNITGINFHDDNLNVIMKATLSRPILKRVEEGFLFKVKQDF